MECCEEHEARLGSYFNKCSLSTKKKKKNPMLDHLDNLEL